MINYRQNVNSKYANYKYSVSNEYDLSGNYGVGYTVNTNEPFYFDLEDYDLIKDFRWLARHRTELDRNKDEYYIEESINRKRIHFHHIVLGYDDFIDKNIPIIDHINGIKHDCRKINLRLTDNRMNSINKKPQKSNKSGIIGVHFNSHRGLWVANINKEKGKRIDVYVGKSFEKAVIARLSAELKYYGEFAPQRHLFEMYNIKDGDNAE